MVLTNIVEKIRIVVSIANERTAKLFVSTSHLYGLRPQYPSSPPHHF